MNIDTLLERYRHETTPSHARVRAVEADLVRRGVPLGAPGLDPSSRRPWRRRAAAGALALAAAGILVFAGTRPAPSTQVQLESGGWQSLEIDESITVAFHGLGEVSGSAEGTEIAWETGTLRVEVEPGQGSDLVVTTREARVRVVGTVFELTRDAMGTTVRVERGVVQVTCHLADPVRLVLADEITCGPVSAASILGRALRLRETGADPERVIAAADEGLGLAAEGSHVAVELRVVRMRALADLGRTEEALAAAEALLVEGAGTRRPQVEAFVEEHRLALENGLE